MVGFIIPLKPQFVSNDWEHDCNLLSKTIRSILNQTSQNFCIYVVYTDKPENIIHDKKVEYIQSPFKFLTFDQIPKKEEELKWHKDKGLLEKRLDKSKKIIYGCQKAKNDGCKYLMSVDSDDLVSSKITAFVIKNSEGGRSPGWYINKGYVLAEKSKIAIKNYHMHSFNGSTHILREDLVKIPDYKTAHYVDYSMFTAHGWTYYRIKDSFKELLSPLGFFGVVYIVHDNNISRIKSLHSRLSIKNIFKRIFRGKWVTKRMKREFSLT